MVGTRTIRWKCSTRAMLQAVNVSSQKIAILTLPEWLRCEEPEDTPWKMGATRQNVTLTQRPCDELSPMLRLVVEFPIVLFLEELEEHLRKLYEILSISWIFACFSLNSEVHCYLGAPNWAAIVGNCQNSRQLPLNNGSSQIAVDF